MNQVRFGKTEMQVSEVAFGGIPIMRLSKPDAVAVVKTAIDEIHEQLAELRIPRRKFLGNPLGKSLVPQLVSASFRLRGNTGLLLFGLVRHVEKSSYDFV